MNNGEEVKSSNVFVGGNDKAVRVIEDVIEYCEVEEAIDRR